MPPPSSGGLTLALIAQQLAAFDLKSLGWHSAPALHLMAESRQTTHFSVADAAGNAVALTTIINGWYGAAVTVAGAGFLLNNEMDDFSAKPGTPNMFGLVQGEANAVAPSKRMLSAMSPTIVLGGDQKPMLVTGASGGPFIITTVFQAISNRLDYGLGASALMRAPRMHHQHLPDVLLVETPGFDPAALAELRRLGHTVRDVKDVDGGSVGATIERRDGRWFGQSDPRLTGLAKGY